MIEQHIRDFLRDDADITDRVAHRIAPGRLRQGELGEAIIVQEISNVPTYSTIGEVGIHDKVVQITSYAASPKAAYTLAELVRNRLSGYRGSIGDGDASTVQSCRIISAGADEERPEDASDRWIHKYRQDFALFENASIPTLV